jgi:Ni/Fe-hydrogenase subunit HybB-like protein
MNITMNGRQSRWLFPAWAGALLFVMAAGAVAGILVFIRGLALTNLSDMVPWGLWITIDLSSIALAAGAFTLSAAVYLLGIKKLQPVARTAVFIGLIGYTMAVLSLMLDIGRPDRFWHAVAFWNIHSPLWEVTMCVCLYLAVLVLEVLPIFGDAEWMRRRWPRLASSLVGIHRLAPVLAVAGLGFSLLHQSSLGATYGVLKARPIWYRPGLAVLFIASAIVAGPALTVLASQVSARLTPRAVVDRVRLETVSRFIGWALIAYLYLRFWDMLAMSYTYEPARTEGLNLLTRGPLAFNFWVGEMLLGIVVPMIILLNRRLRAHGPLHMLALLLIVGGLVAYRWNTNLVGQLIVFSALPQQLAPTYTHYVPSLVEIAAGAGIVAYGLLAFTLGVRYLRVVDHRLSHEHEAATATVPVPVTLKG